MGVLKKRLRSSMAGIVGPLVIVALIVLSPLITSLISRYAYDWAKLSNVGQSYGMVATILSGAALLGVVWTVQLQRQQTTLLAEQAARQLHFNVIQQAWQDPSLLQALEIVPKEQDELARQCVYINFYFMYFRMGYRAGNIAADEIEDLAAHCFSTQAGQQYWQRIGGHMTEHFENEFVSALSRGYARAQVRHEGFFLDPPDASPPAASNQRDTDEQPETP